MKIELTKEQIAQLTGGGEASKSNKDYKLQIQGELFEIKGELERTLRRVNNIIKDTYVVKNSYVIEESSLIELYNKGLTPKEISIELKLPSSRGLGAKISSLVKRGKVEKRTNETIKEGVSNSKDAPKPKTEKEIDLDKEIIEKIDKLTKQLKGGKKVKEK